MGERGGMELPPWDVRRFARDLLERLGQQLIPGAAAGQRQITRSQQGWQHPPEVADGREAAGQFHQPGAPGGGEARPACDEPGQSPAQPGVTGRPA